MFFLLVQISKCIYTVVGVFFFVFWGFFYNLEEEIALDDNVIWAPEVYSHTIDSISQSSEGWSSKKNKKNKKSNRTAYKMVVRIQPKGNRQTKRLLELKVRVFSDYV